MASAIRARRMLAVCLSALLGTAAGFRTQHDEELSLAGAALGGAEQGMFGCQRHSSCASCLAGSPFMGDSGSYCQWCPAENWIGADADLNGQQGTCVAGWTKRADKCGGSGWHFASRPGLEAERPRASENVSRVPMVAANSSVALEFCPAPHAPSAHSLATMSAADLTKILNDTEALTNLLGSINTDVERLDILRGVNPALFDTKFVPSYAGTAGKWAWKLGVYGVGFAPIPGLSLGLGLVGDAASAAISSAEERGKSQSDLISKGSSTGLSYFTDVNFGKLLSAYKTVFSMSEASVEQALHTIAGSGLAGEGGKAAGTFKTIGDSALAKTGKAALGVGLFVGGFFTGGITWIVGTAVGGADIFATAGTDAAVAEAVALKMEMLVGMARTMDASAWRESEGEVCDITAWSEGRNPCPPKEVPGVEDPMRRVCGRFSPWGGVTSGRPGDPEGRCLPAVEPQLAVGMPCLTHSSCSSGLCHFEPRLQYFFSDHARRYCAPDDRDCLSVPEQLEVLEGARPVLPDENGTLSEVAPKLRSVVEKFDSYDGVSYATTGTCSVACPAPRVGKGDCEPLTHQRSGTGFGIRRKGRQLFAHHEGFSRVGTGSCATGLGLLAATTTHGLQSNGTLRYKECARLCAHHNLSSFSVDHAAASCSLFAQSAWKTGPSKRTVCFVKHAHWPLNAYQPWNAAWREYNLDLKQVLNFIDEGRGLPEVRQAYKGYCTQKATSWFSSDVELAGCPSPEQWDEEQAKRMLLLEAPLSASQLHGLHAQLSPASAEATAAGSHDEVLTEAELARRPHGFGEAWLRLLAGSRGKLGAQGMSRSMVERFEALAEEGDLRLADGTWDLAAAGEIYVQEMGLVHMEKR